MFMAQKRGPKTLTGMIRKMETGDGRKKTNLEKIMDGDVNPYTGEKVKKKIERERKIKSRNKSPISQADCMNAVHFNYKNKNFKNLRLFLS